MKDTQKLLLQLMLLAGIVTLALLKAEGWGWLMIALFITF